MTKDEPSGDSVAPEESVLTPEEKREQIIDSIISAPVDAVERVYDEIGGSIAHSAGGALGAAAGVAVGGPVGGIVGAVVGKKAAGKLTSQDGSFIAEGGPSAVGAYPHLHRVGDLLFVSGMGPRTPGDNEIPGGPVRDAEGTPLDYDIHAQTHSVINNVRVILEEYGSSLDRVVDVLACLIDMERDFPSYNEVYAEYFSEILPARTTVGVDSLPSPIAIELKVVAKA
ncbi:MAG: Rid family hydrolase [Candidatus Thalassarchaeaceae archaeon]|nr:Rid family hydrolase [Candidatus Thalassarchaeaceae archaeon]MDP7092379.1 Rid family hydrolase [Candidatus Thalassarchaeaceae archaeon]MDP7256976.1 Rid family hydrolase [Candidatus Thalassarchaeaceae archaeon]MDP7446324.1 Rid family hydrolase [Candidatus Thalassarchaeaceae archaeon]MDP7649306.1 Rid family hydrolase [Candidatus Thalassarchaeaceae archaeon]